MKKITAFIITIFSTVFLFASTVEFSGKYTKVNLQDNNKSVTLSDEAFVKSDSITVASDTITLSGEDYSNIACKGKVAVTDEKNNISMQTTNLFYNRKTNNITADGWIEIQDYNNNATLCGSWLEYNTNANTIKIQMMARIVKDTEDGKLSCRADSIIYDNANQILTLKGDAKVTWGQDNYNASLIIVNLKTSEISLHGSISGEVNG